MEIRLKLFDLILLCAGLLMTGILLEAYINGYRSASLIIISLLFVLTSLRIIFKNRYRINQDQS